MTKSNVGKKVFISSYTSGSQSVTGGRNWNKFQREMLLTSLFLMACYALFLIETRTTYPEVVLPGLDPPNQSLVKKIPNGLAYRLVLQGHFLSWEFYRESVHAWARICVFILFGGTGVLSKLEAHCFGKASWWVNFHDPPVSTSQHQSYRCTSLLPAFMWMLKTELWFILVQFWLYPLSSVPRPQHSIACY